MQHHELCDCNEAELKGEHHVECGGASALVTTLLVHHHGLRKRGARELLYLAQRVDQRQIADSGGVRHRPCAAAEASQRREPPVHAQNVTEIQWGKGLGGEHVQPPAAQFIFFGPFSPTPVGGALGDGAHDKRHELQARECVRVGTTAL